MKSHEEGSGTGFSGLLYGVVVMEWLQLVGSLKVEVSFAEYMQNVVSFIGFFFKRDLTL